MGVKNNTQRIFILTIVVVFFLTSVALTGFVIWDQVRKNDATTAQNEIPEEVRKQLEAQQNQSNPEEKTVKLEGTKLEGFTPVEKVTELQIIDTKVGTGAEVPAGATVTAHYTGALAKDGTIFQSSHDTGDPIPFSLNGVIKGWTEGVPGMKEGGKRRLIIPAEKAYGAQSPSANIPPNSDLVFDIELVKLGE